MVKSFRRNKRFNLNIEALYFYESKWKPCYIIDINLEGAGVILKEQLQINENFKLKIAFAQKEYIFECNVMNVKGFKVGVIFKNIDKENIDFLKKLINTKTDRFKI